MTEGNGTDPALSSPKIFHRKNFYSWHKNERFAPFTFLSWIRKNVPLYVLKCYICNFTSIAGQTLKSFITDRYQIIWLYLSTVLHTNLQDTETIAESITFVSYWFKFKNNDYCSQNRQPNSEIKINPLRKRKRFQ